MYKCSECGCEFEKKPDYCDCGNDIFIESSVEIKKVENRIKEDSILKKNLPSVVFLIICIILSFVIIFFIGNPKDEPVKKIKSKPEVNKKLPDIDKLWNDEKPLQNVQKKADAPKITADNKLKITKVELKKEPQKINIPVVINNKKQVQKNKEIQNNKTQIKQQIQSKQQSTQKQVISQPKKQQTAEAKKQTQQATSVSSKPQQNTQVNTQNIKIAPMARTNPEELKQYKKALRNKIASNIDFLNVAGDGKCSLSFNISSQGNLLNRRFVSQSQNTSLNDAVYAAMLKVSSFKAPPDAYKNETMKLIVQISGGNFSVSLE